MAAVKHAIIDIVRHFPTELNEPGEERVRGQMAVGIDQRQADRLAPRVARVLQADGVTTIYCSDLRRGMETAEAVAQHLPGVRVVRLRRMRTWDVGKFTGELRKQALQELQRYIKHSDEKIPGGWTDEMLTGRSQHFAGESFDQYMDRWGPLAAEFVEQALEDPGERFALVLHGNQIWTLPTLLQGRKFDRFTYSVPPPGTVLRLDVRASDSSAPSDVRIEQVKAA